MATYNCDAARREFPEAAEHTDAEIIEMTDFIGVELIEIMRELKRKGEAILAEREAQN